MHWDCSSNIDTVGDLFYGCAGIVMAVFMTFFVEPKYFWRAFSTFRGGATFKNLPLFWLGIAVSFSVIVGINVADCVGLEQTVSRNFLNFSAGFAYISAFLYFYRVWGSETPAGEPRTTPFSRSIEDRVFLDKAMRAPTLAERRAIWDKAYKDGWVTEKVYTQWGYLLEEETDDLEVAPAAGKSNLAAAEPVPPRKPDQ